MFQRFNVHLWFGFVCPVNDISISTLLKLVLTYERTIRRFFCKDLHIHCVPKNVPLCDCLYLCQILTDFQNVFTDAFCRQLTIKWLLNIPPQRSAHDAKAAVNRWRRGRDGGRLKPGCQRQSAAVSSHHGVRLDVSEPDGHVWRDGAGILQHSDMVDYYLLLKTVKRHSTDKPWVSDQFRHLIRCRQHALKTGQTARYRAYRNRVQRMSRTLRRK